MHDLRNGIGGVHTKLTLAQMSGDIGQELYDDCIKSIKYTLSKLVEIGESFDAEAHPVTWVSIDRLISMLIEETSSVVVNTTLTHTIKCDFNIACIALIENNFRSVIEEVIRNGLKYGATIFHIHISMKEDVLKIFIKDNGKGLNQRTLETMGVGSNSDGTRIVQQLMMDMRGRVRWYSDGYSTIVLLSFESNNGVNN